VEGQINGGRALSVDTGAHDRSVLGRRRPAGDRLPQGAAGPDGHGERLRGGLQGKLDTVRVGDIVANNVAAAVLEGSPIPFCCWE
jgi:hypothetical protein